METLILIIHVIVAFSLIAIILLQQGKGADAGASFGSGASQTVFGGRGSSNFLGKVTTAMAVILLVTSISLDILTKQKHDGTDLILDTENPASTKDSSASKEASNAKETTDPASNKKVDPAANKTADTSTAKPDALKKNSTPEPKTELSKDQQTPKTTSSSDAPSIPNETTTKGTTVPTTPPQPK